MLPKAGAIAQSLCEGPLSTHAVNLGSIVTPSRSTPHWLATSDKAPEVAPQLIRCAIARAGLAASGDLQSGTPVLSALAAKQVPID